MTYKVEHILYDLILITNILIYDKKTNIDFYKITLGPRFFKVNYLMLVVFLGYSKGAERVEDSSVYIKLEKCKSKWNGKYLVLKIPQYIIFALYQIQIIFISK